MKWILYSCLLIVMHMPLTFGAILPDEISLSFQRYGQRIPGSEDLYGEQKSFVEYVCKNWREIAEDIECLPPLDGVEIKNGVKFNCSVINFGRACCRLSPTEYVDFFEQVLNLREQKRISFTAFENMYYGSWGKECFWSVNWEHPRVQGIFKRIRKFDPPPDADFLSLMEKQAHGKLADNYMASVSDDEPLPQTLPGIKLQRPFATLIRKYERVTGKKLPSDPDFPEDASSRPERRPGQGDSGSGVEQVVELTTLGKSLLGGILALLAAGIAWGIARWRRKPGK